METYGLEVKVFEKPLTKTGKSKSKTEILNRTPTNERIIGMVKSLMLHTSEPVEGYVILNKHLVGIVDEMLEEMGNGNPEPARSIHFRTAKSVGTMTPAPDSGLKEKRQRDVLMIAGPSGSGKSTYLGSYVMNYNLIYPANNVFVFSGVSRDEAIDDLNVDVKRIVLDDSFCERQESDCPITVADFQDSLVIFDDTDTIRNNQARELVFHLREELLQTGRHTNTCMAVTSHHFMNYGLTRTLNMESTSITFFPKSGGLAQIKKYLQTYVGLDKDQINKLVKLPSRWVTVSKTYPLYAFYEGGAFLLD